MRARYSSLCVSTALAYGFLAGTSAVALELSPTSPRYQAAVEAAGGDVADAAATAAAAEPAPSRIRVKYREGPDAATPEAAASDVAASIARGSDALVETVVPAGDSTETIVLDRTLSEEELRRIAESVATSPSVEWAVVEKIEQAQQTSDDLISDQWHYHLDPVSIRLVPAWAQSTGTDIVVAVIDSGYREHEDITAHILDGYDFIASLWSSNDGDGRDPDATDPGDWCIFEPPLLSSWHGLHVSGTIAALTDNELGVAGVGRDAKILPVRVLGQCGGSSFDITDGIRWAAGAPVAGVPNNPTPAKVINLSLGGLGPCDSDYEDAISEARQRGVTVVVAAGNDDMDAAGFRPANCDGVISVAATNRDGARAYFGDTGSGSNFGPSVDIAAPGGETYAVAANGILSTLNAGITAPGADSYEAYQGTSMAAPHVAGVVALLYQVYPSITPDEALSILQVTSQPFPTVTSRQCTTALCGAGIVDAEAAVAEAIKRASGKAAISSAPAP